MLLLVLITAAADLNGKWSGTASAPDDSKAFVLKLKVSGTEVTGTAGPGEDSQFNIENRRLDRNRFTFQVTSPAGGVFHFELTLDGNSLKGPCSRLLGRRNPRMHCGSETRRQLVEVLEVRAYEAISPRKATFLRQVTAQNRREVANHSP
jgi:hypothetical protein